ncbi:MAG: hypothetical protein QNK37_04555 [Acidobacteriota bacterium]|nr:hypothetical protein [Acidobacteriota bacterium]
MTFRILFILTAMTAVFGSDPSIIAETDNREAYLGDAVVVRSVAKYDSAEWTSVVPAESYSDKLDKATVLGHDVGEPVKPEGVDLVTLTQTIRLAWYELGEFKVPPLKWVGTRPDGSLETFETPELNIEIIAMLEEGDEQMAGQKDQVDLERPPLWPWIVGALLLIVLVVFLIRTILRRMQKPPAPKPEIVIPPYEEALQRLEDLTHGSMLKEGRVKDFYVAINSIVRRYYARLYNIHAEEMTSFELDDWMTNNGSLPAATPELNREFQDACDRVKFAKYDPVEAENREVVNRAYQLVEMLRPKPQPQSPTEVTDVAAG